MEKKLQTNKQTNLMAKVRLTRLQTKAKPTEDERIDPSFECRGSVGRSPPPPKKEMNRVMTKAESSGNPFSPCDTNDEIEAPRWPNPVSPRQETEVDRSASSVGEVVAAANKDKEVWGSLIDETDEGVVEGAPVIREQESDKVENKILEDEEKQLGGLKEIGARLRRYIMAETNRVSKSACEFILSCASEYEECIMKVICENKRLKGINWRGGGR